MSALSLYSSTHSLLKNDQVSWQTLSQAESEVGSLLKKILGKDQVVVWALLICGEAEWAALKDCVTSLGAWSQWPLMAMTHGESGWGGLQVMTCPSSGMKPLMDSAGRVVGMFGADEVSLCGLTSTSSDPRESARDCLELSQELLSEAGFGWQDVYRTWYYNRDILGWYDDFNEERKEFFAAQQVNMEHPPASTGIGLSPAEGGWVCLSLMAGGCSAGSGPVASPLQGEAVAYGSLFSRAYEQETGEQRRLWISGTASIDESGASVYLEDLEGQMTQTHRVVEALMESRGMSWDDVSRAIVYVRRAEDLPRCREMYEGLALKGGVPLLVPAVVCRDDLLFELELEAQR